MGEYAAYYSRNATIYQHVVEMKQLSTIHVEYKHDRLVPLTVMF